MIKMSGKIVGVIAGTSAALIAGTTVAANLLIKDEKGVRPNDNPLNRDKHYHHYSIVNKISNNEKLNDLISIVKYEGNIFYVIKEETFLKNIKNIVQEALKSISLFSASYLNYVIECNYKMDTQSVLVDLVWYLPNAKDKYFDQFEIILQTT